MNTGSTYHVEYDEGSFKREYIADPYALVPLNHYLRSAREKTPMEALSN